LLLLLCFVIHTSNEGCYYLEHDCLNLSPCRLRAPTSCLARAACRDSKAASCMDGRNCHLSSRLPSCTALRSSLRTAEMHPSRWWLFVCQPALLAARQKGNHHADWHAVWGVAYVTGYMRLLAVNLHALRPGLLALIGRDGRMWAKRALVVCVVSAVSQLHLSGTWTARWCERCGIEMQLFIRQSALQG